MDTNNNSIFIGDFAVSLRDHQTGLEPDPSGADSLSGCTPQLEFDTATSIATNGKVAISDCLQVTSGKGRFQSYNRSGCKKEKQQW